MAWRIKKHRDPEIAPDEIFLDSSNAPAFDKAHMEGRLETPLLSHTFFYLAAILAVLFLILIIRAWDLQIVNGARFALLSEQNSLEEKILFARRGVITDFQGVILAENTEQPDGTTLRNYKIPSLGTVIGYVSYPKKDSRGVYFQTQEIGIAGIEMQYDYLLAGENGKILVEKDVFGNVRSEGTIISAQNGDSLRLSIDANLVEHLAKAISYVAKNNGFIAGAGIIMDVHTGAIRAIVSYPSYDPNVIANNSSQQIIAEYKANPGRPFLNHAVSGVYAPGSVVKPFIALGALVDGIITANTLINDPGFISLPNPYNPGDKFIFRSWRELGIMDVRNAIAWSSSVYFYAIGGGFGLQRGLGIDRINYWYRQFGFGELTGVDLPGEVAGLIPNPAWKRAAFNEPWYLGDTYFTAIGQYAMQATPIQMVRATAAIANGGKLLRPTMLADAQSSYSIVPVDEVSLEIVKEGMRLAVTEAIAGGLNIPYIKIAAKTGTAETGARNEFINSWVEGFFPYENPRYAFVVVLERGPAGTGGQAVNVMRKFFDALYLEDSVYLRKQGTEITNSDTI